MNDSMFRYYIKILLIDYVHFTYGDVLRRKYMTLQYCVYVRVENTSITFLDS